MSAHLSDAASMSIKDLKASMRALKVSEVDIVRCNEKHELVSLLRQAQEQAARKATACPYAHAKASGSSNATSASSSMSVREMKAALKAKGYSVAGCTEKSELLARLQKAERELKQRQEPDAVAPVLGRHIMNTALTGGRTTGRITPDMLWALGGQQGWVNIFEEHYKRLFGDPRMNVLFGHRSPEPVSYTHLTLPTIRLV